MRVKFLQAIAGPSWSFRPGEVVELDAIPGLAWVASGVCEEVPPESAALAGAPEKAVLTAARPKNRSQSHAEGQRE